MDKRTDITEQSQASTSETVPEPKTEDLEEPTSTASGVAGPVEKTTEGSDAIGAKIPLDLRIKPDALIARAEGEVESEQPAKSNSASGAGEGTKANNPGNSGAKAASTVPAEIETSAMRPKDWDRRRVITLGLSAAAGIVAVFWSPLSDKMASIWQALGIRRENNPYFRVNKSSAIYAPVALSEGFYARRSKPISKPLPANARRRNIIQYVDSSNRVPFVPNIDETKLMAAEQSQLAVNGFTLSAPDKSPFPATHVSLGRASALFEIAALQRIRAEEYSQACQHLIDGIRHDLAFKRGVGGAPSLRLLDLLAIVSIRRNQGQHFQELLKLSNDTMRLIERQNIDPPARRKAHKNKPPTKKGRSDNPRKRRLPLDPATQEIVRAKSKAGLEARVKKWQGAPWQEKIKQKKIVKWEMRILPLEIKEESEKGKSEKEMSKKEKRELEKKRTVRLEI